MLIIREFETDDAEAVSSVIRQTMKISNSVDYPLAQLQPLMDYFSPAKLRQLARERICLVAEVEGHIVGTIALEGNTLATFFVHPDYQRQGLGTKLLQAIEAVAIKNDLDHLEMHASLTGLAFYERMGYQQTGDQIAGTAGPQIGMRKFLKPPHD